MIGAIAGDIIGSIYEFDNIKTKDFELFGPHPNAKSKNSTNGFSDTECRFTDDTVLTIAVARWLMDGGYLVDHLCHFGLKYPNRGYGGMFYSWMNSWDRQPYNSYGNGSAMRVSPVAWLIDDTCPSPWDLAKTSAEVTHNHPEGIKGAQAVAMAIMLARRGAGKRLFSKQRIDATKALIKNKIRCHYGYSLNKIADSIRVDNKFDETCQGTVPPAIICALRATDYEDAIRNAISIGGDSDTIACITGSIAEALFGMPKEIVEKARSYLPDDMIEVLDRFIEYEDIEIESHVMAKPKQLCRRYIKQGVSK